MSSENPFNYRFYTTSNQSLDVCRCLGSTHKGYNWGMKLDPRWTDEQKKAYKDAYDEATIDESW